MTILQKFSNKFETYKGKVKTYFFRITNKIFPRYFDIDRVSDSVFPLGYCIPDELILDGLPEKKNLWAEVIPGFIETYRFGNEQDYYGMYAEAKFAYTWKKGGWDCLRHYEILGNGTIPVFPDLGNCPSDTLSHLPKSLIIQANRELLPWKNTQAYQENYQKYASAILNHCKENISCSAVSKLFLENLGAKSHHKILFLNCDSNVNYSRELLFIGLSRELELHNGLCHPYPALDFLYEDYPAEKASKCYGRGFGYTRRLKPLLKKESLPSNDVELEDSIRKQHWDFIVYGKMGADEGILGTAPTCPFWKIVSESYSKDQIAFVYGGDHMQNMKDMGSKHSRHLARHARLGKCFVRELKMS
ncbi:hypothetical protein [Algoriphagus yeomjeoni]|uniref:Uncharacterized protein n=1 Tax=Algoriphagus yeomjeoni TaxID=291403 RepID=A0A327PBA9_9BACT|nr:hypothetical protein [Algoriphagus yeomjeoni]RAI89528.1 hypothetical protein LV83_02570 [Algoriphagus yeomjeoni]